MKLWNKTLHIYEPIYHISYDDDGFPLFLVYRDGKWLRVHGSELTPQEENPDIFCTLVNKPVAYVNFNELPKCTPAKCATCQRGVYLEDGV